MSDDRISVVVEDKVDPSIAKDLKAIGSAAKESDSALAILQKTLNGIKSSGLSLLQAEYAKLTAAQSTLRASVEKTETAHIKSATAAQRLATEAGKTAAAEAQAAIKASGLALAQQKVATETQKTAAEAAKLVVQDQKLAQESQKLVTIQQQSALAAQRVATETQRTAAAEVRAEQAKQRLAQQSANLRRENELTTQSFMRFRSILTTVAAAVTTGLFTKITSEFTDYQSRIDRISKSQVEATNTMRRLQEMSDRTYSSFQQTAESYITNYESLSALGYAQSDVLDYTEAINNALVVSGAKGEQAASVTYALTKAMGLGVLRGQELNSVLARGGRITQAIAEYMGVEVTQLRKLGEQGKITSQVLMEAMVKSGDRLKAEADKMPATIGDAINRIKSRIFTGLGNWDKEAGISQALSKQLLWLADNLDSVAVAATAAGIALAIAFAPSMAAGVVALLNPVVLVTAAITAAAFYFSAFGHEMYLSGEECKKFGVTYSDVFSGVGQETKSIANDVWKTMSQLFSDVRNESETTADQIKKSGEEGFMGLALSAARAVDAVIGYLGGLGRYIGRLFATLKEGGSMTFDDLGKMWADSLNDSFKERMEKGWEKSLKNIVDRSKVNAAFRELNKPFQDLLRNQGNNDPRGKGRTSAGDGKAEMKRADALAKVNRELDTELKLIGMLKPEREITAQFSQIESQLAEKKIKLSQSEADAIRNKVIAIQQNKVVQAEMDRIQGESTSALSSYNATLEAAEKLLSMKAITQEYYNDTVEKATEKYKEAIFPMDAVNRKILGNIEYMRMNTKEQGIYTIAQQIRQDVERAGKKITDDVALSINKQAEAIYELEQYSRQLNQVYDQTIGLQEQLIRQFSVLDEAKTKGYINTEQYALGVNKLAVEFINLKMRMEESVSFNELAISSLGQFVQNYEGILPGLSASFGDFFSSLNNGFADSIGRAIVYSEDLGAALKGVAQQAVSQLISSLIKLGMQWAVNAAIGQSLAATSLATQTAMSVAAASATAAAWAPAAAMVSLASFGANSAPAMSGIAATTAMSKAMSLTSLAGFESGGYTGNTGVKDIAGVVHGKEFVVNAGATKANRPTLEAMNRGESVGRGETKLNIIIEDHTTGTRFDVEQMDEETVRIIARQEIQKETDGAVASALSNPNSKTSRAQSRYTKTERQY